MIWNYIKKNAKIFAVSISLPILVGLFSAFLTKGNMNIYGEIVKPPLAPPALLFPIVWTLLYALMGISSAIIYADGNRLPEAKRRALSTYLISLLVNFSWSIIFFNVKEFFIALITLVFLLYLIIKTIIEYRRISPLAAYLQIPYALWVAFAGYLNFAIVLLNK